jgi:hypothetical protein
MDKDHIKACTKCGATDHAFGERRKRGKNGKLYIYKKAWCVDCEREYQRNYARKYKKDPVVWDKILTRRRINYDPQTERGRTIRRAQNNPLHMRVLRILRTIKVHSKELGFALDPVVDYSLVLTLLDQNPSCQSCKRQMDFGFSFDGKNRDSTVTIDRVDSFQGYVHTNLGVLCWRCNSIKKDASLGELTNLIHYMREHTHEV